MRISLQLLLVTILLNLSGCGGSKEEKAYGSKEEKAYNRWVSECLDYEKEHPIRGYEPPVRDAALSSKNLQEMLSLGDPGIDLLTRKYLATVDGKPGCSWDYFLKYPLSEIYGIRLPVFDDTKFDLDHRDPEYRRAVDEARAAKDAFEQRVKDAARARLLKASTRPSQ